MKTITLPRISLGIAILMMAVDVPLASASTDYNIIFTATTGIDNIDGTGSFTYDGSVFTNFTIAWGTETYDVTSAANLTSPMAYTCDGNATISFFTVLT